MPGDKTRAIRNAFRQLGMHVKAEAVVQVLAGLGIRVSAELVRRVHVAMLKSTGAGPQPAPVRRPAVRRPPKRPPRR